MAVWAACASILALPQSLSAAFTGLGNAHLFVNNASRHLGYEYTDMSPSLMFWCLNLPALVFFHEVSNNWIKYTVIRKVSHRCTHTEVKVHPSLFKNKPYAMSFSIYAAHISMCFFGVSGKLTKWGKKHFWCERAWLSTLFIMIVWIV